MNETNEKYVFCVEEDTVCDPSLVFEFNKSKLPQNFDIIFLNYNAREKYRWNEDYYALRKSGLFWMTNAYIISRQGASKILERYRKDKITMQFDSYLSLLHQEGVLRLFFSRFRYFPQKKSHKTTIQTTVIENPSVFDLR